MAFMTVTYYLKPTRDGLPHDQPLMYIGLENEGKRFSAIREIS